VRIQPLRLVPRVSPRIWGGDRLSRFFGRPGAEGQPIGESWEVHGDLMVAGGDYQGMTLDELTRQEGEALLGQDRPPAGTFPLLVKWLDCQDWLSVQVHPDDAVARRLTGNPQASGKTECWFIVEAGPDARLIHGLTPGSRLEDLARAQGRQVLEHLNILTPTAGQVLFTPAGLVHALGPGLLLLEVQQSSDLTYRLYDWDRPGLDGAPRALHREEALEAIRDSRPGPSRPAPAGGIGEALVSCSHFAMEALSASASWSPAGRSVEILVQVQGRGRVLAEGRGEALAPGDVVLVPAASRTVQLHLEPCSRALRVRLPDPA